MHASSSPSGRPRRLTALAAILAVTATASPAAHAIVFWDEVTFYLTHANYSPGDQVSTTFTFGSKPAFDLSTFEFTLSWDTPLAAPVATGPGSVEEWAAKLRLQGSVDYGYVDAQTLRGVWTADPAGGAASFISTSYENPIRTVFTFQTSTQLNTPFVVSIELTNIREANGEIMDTGSGFINWAHLTPVPEPEQWALWLMGIAGLAAGRARTLSRPGGPSRRC